MGGGWCDSAQNCAARALTFLGSSKPWPPEYNLNDTYFAPSATLNPLMYNWNVVFMVYCDGGSFTGNRKGSITVGNQTIFYRGALIREAIKGDLVANQNFGELTDLVVSGASAGGLATYLHVDWWASQVSKSAKVVGLPDCGFFLDWKSPSNISHSYNAAMQYVYKAMNPTLHPQCIVNRSKDKQKCLFAEHVSPFIKTPVFALQARFDTWQLANELGTNATAPVQHYGGYLTELFAANFLSNPKNGAFLDSCAHHCGAYDSIFTQTINAANAFKQWYMKSTSQRLWFQKQLYPCSACCNNQP
jgi:hypothetical protein